MADLDVIVVPVSGGGMLAGIALAAKAAKPGILVVAAEPAGSNDAADVAASLAARACVTTMEAPRTIADGLRYDQPAALLRTLRSSPPTAPAPVARRFFPSHFPPQSPFPRPPAAARTWAT